MYRVDYKSLVILSLSALFLCCHQAYSATGATTNSPDMQEYLFAQGKRLYESGRPDQAVNVWKNIPRDSFYDPVVSMLSAKCYSKLGRHDQAEKELKEFLSRHNDSPYRDAARRALFDALHSQGKAEALELVPAVSRGAKEKVDFRTSFVLEYE